MFPTKFVDKLKSQFYNL